MKYSPKLLLLCLLLSSVLFAQRRYDFQEIKLENGMKILSLEDFSCPIVAIQVWYHVGAKDEDPKRQGFAHMFEHMMFRGTERLGPEEHFNYIRRVGGDTNAYTAFDQTVYVQEVPSNQLEMVLWLEAERMAFLKIDREGFFTERKVVEEELRQGHDRPYGRVPEKLLAAVYGKHPYAWTPGGQIEHLRESTIDELQAFWDKYYVPNNATLVVVGAVKHADVQKLAKKYFGWIPKCPQPEQVKIPSTEQKKQREIKISEEKGPLPVVGVLYRTVPQSHPDALPLEILMSVLGGGESSRLYVDVVKKQELAQIAMAGAFNLEQDGIAGAGGVLLPFGNKEKLLAGIQEHLKKVMDEPITKAELNKIKNQLLRQEVTGSLTVASKANLLGQYGVLEGDAEKINRRVDEIEKVTIQDIQRVAKKYLTSERQIVLKIEPTVLGMIKSFFGGGKKEATEKTKELENKVAKRTGPKATAVRPKDFPNKPPSAELLDQFPKIASTTKTLSNGLKVVVVSNNEVPFISMRLGCKRGAWSEEKPGTANMAMSILTKGTTKYDAIQLSEFLESNAINLSGSAEMDNSNIRASALVNQLDKMVDIFGEVVQNATFPEKELTILKKQSKLGLMVSTKTPDYLANKTLRQQLYGKHPYSRTVTGEMADIDAIQVADLKTWFKNNIRPEHTILYFAGDIKAEKAFELAEKYLKDWKSTTPSPSIDIPPIPAKKSTHIYLVDQPGSAQSQIRIGHTSIKRQDPLYFNSRVLGTIFGGGFNSRLNKSIRVEKGLTYGASGGFSPSKFSGQFTIRTFTKTPSTEETVRVILEEIDKIQTNAPTPEELNDTKSYVSGSFPGRRETPNATIGDLWLIETQGLPVDYLQRYLQGIKATTAAEVLSAANTLIEKKNLTIVVVGDAKVIQKGLEKIAPVTVIGAKKK